MQVSLYFQQHFSDHISCMSSCSVQPSNHPSGRGHLLDNGKVDRMAISTQYILLAEDVICLKIDIKINYIPTTLSLQHSCPSMQDSLKNEGISIWFVLSLSISAFPLCPKYYKIYLSYPNERKKSWILNSLDFIGSIFFFVLFQNVPACLPNNASNFVNKIVIRIRIFFWIFMSSGSELHPWIPLFEWWEWNGHSYHFYPRRGLKWHGGLFASIVVWKYMVIMLIDPSNHLLFHVTCDHFTIILLSHINFKTLDR